MLWSKPSLSQIRKNELKTSLKSQRKTLAALKGHVADHAAVSKLEAEHKANERAIADLRKQITNLTA